MLLEFSRPCGGDQCDAVPRARASARKPERGDYPARRDDGAAVAEELVTDLLTDMKTGTSYDADILPLMQHALLWLWQDACREANLDAPLMLEVEYAQPVFHVRQPPIGRMAACAED